MSADLQQQILNSDLIYSLTRNLPNPELISDEAANDSDKTLTVPANQLWEILWVFIDFAPTDTVGNRTLRLNILDNSEIVIASYKPGVDQPKDNTKHYLFAQNLPRETSFFAGDKLYHPLSQIYLPAGYKIRIYDSSGIDPTADDMIIQMMVNRFDI